MEQHRLNSIAAQSLYSEGVMQKAITYCYSVIARHISGSKCLELGPAEGVMTSLLYELNIDLTVVEGSVAFSESLRHRFPMANVVNSLFEDFVPESKFDFIVLGHVLEHVENPKEILELCGTWLNPNGTIFAAVPNALSLHRQAAVIMGLLQSEHTLNDLDLHHGHRRVYDPASFRGLFNDGGFDIKKFGGYWLKPISNSQIENSWSSEMIDAFMLLGEAHPEIAGELYIVASKAT